MIVSQFEKESEHEGMRALLIRGTTREIVTELSNIITELLKLGFPEEFLLSVIIEAFEGDKK